MPAELAYPASVASDPQLCEIARAWVAHGGLHCSLRPDVWPADKAAIGWDILVSDFVRHVADALAPTHSLDKKQTLAHIRSVFDKELSAPTAETRGGFEK
jgi:hypothetical protein